MTSKAHNPASIGAPIGAYVHGLETPPNARLLHVSGQVGIADDGSVPPDAEGQARIVWRNIEAILESAGMDIGDIVKMTAYLTDPADLAAYGSVRTAVLGDFRPTSTLVFVSALVKPELKVEVEVVAARA
ncbi:RidA family protein [Pelagibius sp. CAU 1746]|uniref:RidA family protein n=1 Tax=Pelagibius sp. CAU 1746 TaxID=3140370 RepID=UPI00325B6ACA